MKSWLDLLKAACEAEGQTAIATKLGVSQTTINLVVNGKYKPDTKNIQALVEQHLGSAGNWLAALRAEVERTSQSRAATLIGVSPATVSQVLSGNYAADTTRIARRVRGAILRIEVECPSAMQIPLLVCQEIQDRAKHTNHVWAQAQMCCRGEGRWDKVGPCKHACQPAKKGVAA